MKKQIIFAVASLLMTTAAKAELSRGCQKLLTDAAQTTQNLEASLQGSRFSPIEVEFYLAGSKNIAKGAIETCAQMAIVKTSFSTRKDVVDGYIAAHQEAEQYLEALMGK